MVRKALTKKMKRLLTRGGRPHRVRRTLPRRAAPKPGSVENADEGKVEETPAAETLTEAKSDEPPAKRVASKRTSRPAKKPAEPKKPVVDPLASIHLVIDLKNGRSLQRAMNEVFKYQRRQGNFDSYFEGRVDPRVIRSSRSQR